MPKNTPQKSSKIIQSSVIKSPQYIHQKNKVTLWNKSKIKNNIKKTNQSRTVINPNMKNVSHLSNLNEVRQCGEFIEINGKIIRNQVQSDIILRDVPYVQTFASNVHEALLHTIEKYGKNRIIVGCVAWFNSNDIVDALSSNAKAVSFIVNNEDYKKWGFGSVNRKKFENLPAFNRPFSQVWGKKIECELSILKQTYPPVRAFGVASEEKTLINASTMHSKFMVICDENDMPWALWSGTNNFTEKSKRNLENAFFFISPRLAMFYFLHFSRTFVLSSELIY